jgi:hypothetical protein
MDFTQLVSEMVRFVRGRRSQVALSRRLGYRINAVYLWESGRGGLRTTKFLRLLTAVGLDLRAALIAFYGTEPPWLSRTDPTSLEGVGCLLSDLRGGTPIVAGAQAIGCSRFALSRWLSGRADPQAYLFLHAIHVFSDRALDFVACLVDPAKLPSVSESWTRLQNARRAAYELPWSHAVLRALELAQYQRLASHRPGWLAKQLGISTDLEEQCLTVLHSAGQIRKVGGKWVPAPPATTDTRAEPEAARNVALWAFHLGSQRFESRVSGVFSFNVFAVSRRDLAHLMNLQRTYYRELRRIVAASEPAECVAITNLQLFSLLTDGDQEQEREERDLDEGTKPAVAPVAPKIARRRSR